MSSYNKYIIHRILYTMIHSYTTISSFAKMVQETNDLANQREIISENLQGAVLDPLKQLMKDKTIERKKVMTFQPSFVV